jgi:hypothetical protein
MLSERRLSENQIKYDGWVFVPISYSGPVKKYAKSETAA